VKIYSNELHHFMLKWCWHYCLS